MVSGKRCPVSKPTTANVQLRIATYWLVGLGLTLAYVMLR